MYMDITKAGKDRVRNSGVETKTQRSDRRRNTGIKVRNQCGIDDVSKLCRCHNVLLFRMKKALPERQDVKSHGLDLPINGEIMRSLISRNYTTKGKALSTEIPRKNTKKRHPHWGAVLVGLFSDYS